ncbi:MAG: DUF5667 domain-containing protein [Methanoregula sp.]|nr:DUF5667 domain-containing protein [Methanoregula sp.]
MRTGFGVFLVLVIVGFLCIAGTPAAADPANGTYAAQIPNTHQVNGTIGPDNPLYGFRIALENFDESFTYNQSERLEKEINHTDLRLVELQNALAENNTDAINRTLDLYWQKFNQTEDTLGQLASNDTLNLTSPDVTGRGPGNTGLENARNMIDRHQETLQNLTQEYPDNPGLARAYNNSLELMQRFEEKIQERNGSGEPSDRSDNRTFPQGANTSWEQTGGVGNMTQPAPGGTVQGLQNQDRQTNPGTSGGQNQSSDQQVRGNGNSNAADNQETRDSSGADNGQGNGNANGNGNNNHNNNGNSR